MSAFSSGFLGALGVIAAIILILLVFVLLGPDAFTCVFLIIVCLLFLDLVVFKR